MMNQISNDLRYEIPPQNEVDEVFDYLDSKKQGALSFDDFKVLIKDVLKNMISQLFLAICSWKTLHTFFSKMKCQNKINQ